MFSRVCSAPVVLPEDSRQFPALLHYVSEPCQPTHGRRVSGGLSGPQRYVHVSSNDDVTIRWRHHMETLNALLALCQGNPPVDFLHKGPVTHNFRVFFVVDLNKLLSKQSFYRCYETPWCSCDITAVHAVLTYFKYSNFAIPHYSPSCRMMTSSNGNIFPVTGLLCGEFTGHQWIPRTKASDAELWCFLWSAPEYTVQ